MSNIVTVPLNRGKSFRTEPLYQHDYGQVLRLTGIELPPVWEMHFSNEQRGVSVTALGAGDSVAIPDGCLTSGKNVYAWVYLHTGADDGETEYMITIPVIPRAAVGEETPTPVEQSAITEAIAALNAAAGQAARDAGRAETAANGIEGTVADALAAAKASGMFDGPKGDKGDKGDQGETGAVGPQGPQGDSGTDAQARADIAGLKSALSSAYFLSESPLVPSVNLFDQNSPDNRSGEYWRATGTLATEQDAKYCRSHPILVSKGTYRFYISGSYGANAPAVAVVDESGALIRMNNGTNDAGNATASVTFTETCLIQFNYIATAKPKVMFCLAADYPSAYVGVAQAAAAASEANGAFARADAVFRKSGNLFDMNSAGNTAGQYYRLTGEIRTGESENLCASHLIPVGPGTYKFVTSNIFGSHQGAVAVLNSGGGLIRVIAAAVADGVATFSVDRVCNVRFNFVADSKSTVVFCEASMWDGDYHPYENRIDKSLIDSIRKTETDFFSREASENLADLSGAIPGKYFRASDGALVTYTNRPVFAVYVKLDGAGSYVTKTTKQLFGSSAAKLALFDADKTYVATVTGTLGDDSNPYSVPIGFEVSAANIAAGAAYFGLTIENKYLTTTMAVKGSAYPADCMPYYDRWVIDDLTLKAAQAPSLSKNVLYGKTAVFDGDSICSDDTDTSGRGGYPGRIAFANGMAIRNYAVSGGTLTGSLYYAGGSPRHWVSGNVDAMYADFPNADYIIFEGGTNDADLIGSILNSNHPAAFGSFTPNDFSGEYDEETFCGAVETILYKALSHWPGKKIGFVIAMKMGTNVSAYNNRRAYFETIMQICKKWGVPYINLWDECPMNPNLASCYDGTMTAEENIDAGKLYKDGQHPSPAGYARIAPIIEAWMKTL